MNRLSKNTWWMLMLLFSAIPFLANAQDVTDPANLFVNEALTAGYSSSSNQFQFRLNGTILSTGTINYGGGGLLSSDASITGPVFLWYPTKAALWSGFAAAGDIQDSNIGTYSVALGYENSATNYYSTAIGGNNTATQGGSTAIGLSNAVTNQYGVAVGSSNTVGGFTAVAVGYTGQAANTGSVVVGQGSSTGVYSVAIGEGSNSSNFHSVAAGWGFASGQYSVALGNGGATGDYSFATGAGTNAGGPYSCAIGNTVSTGCYNCQVFGAYNLDLSETGGSPSYYNWVDTPNAADPLFEVGDGTSSQRADALVIYKDGNAVFQGSVTVPQSGDIPMYTGGS